MAQETLLYTENASEQSSKCQNYCLKKWQNLNINGFLFVKYYALFKKNKSVIVKINTVLK